MTTPRVTITEDELPTECEILFVRYPIARSLLADTALDRARIADVCAEAVAKEVRTQVMNWMPDPEVTA